MQKVDLYSLLWAYANKIHEPLIKVNVFVDFIEKYAKQSVPSHPEWETWTRNASAKFWEELAPLVDAGKCVVQGVTTERAIYLSQYYVNLIQNVYKNPNDMELIPFPDELSINADFSNDQITVLRLNEDLAGFLDKAEHAPFPIIKLELATGMGDVLILDPMMPKGLLEAALLKIRFYLSIAGNKDFILQKLTVSFHGKSDYPRDILANLVLDPKLIIDEFEKGGEGSYMLWMYFCNLIRSDLSKASPLSKDRIILQAVAIIDRLNFYYNSKMQKCKERDMAFEELGEHLSLTPYTYNMEQITKFKGSDGKLLLSHYSSDELDGYLADNTKADSDKIAPLIIIMDKKEQWFVPKAKFPLACLRLMVTAPVLVKDAIFKRWKKVLLDYQSELSMTSDREFLNMLTEYLKNLVPLLAALLEYRKMSLLFIEMKSDQEGRAEFARLFNKDTGKVLNLDALLLIKRRSLLADVRASIPFWYSFAPIVKLMSFFRGNSGKKPTELRAAGGDANVVKEKPLTFQMVCKQLEAKLVPAEQSLDSYLNKLWDRWARLLKDKDRKNLLEDVNSLVRDRVRRSVRLLKPAQITEEYLSRVAVELIQGSPALQQLQASSLELYIKLYVIKLLRVLPR
jgi:hypothetical protein